MSDYVVTCVQGDNSDLFPSILKLYVPCGSLVLDMTWGNGVFWKQVNIFQPKEIGIEDVPDDPYYFVAANDLDPKRGNFHDDFRHVLWSDGTFDAVVIDPPYLYTGGFKTLKTSIDKGYNNKARSASGIYGVEAVDRMYYDGMAEAYRVLKPKGILILKCQDQVMSGEQVWAHETYGCYGIQLGFKKEDLFVLHQKNQPLMRHKPELQKHARRNHSYFLVFRKNGNGRGRKVASR